ncbi:MAG: hypothetical protein IJV70_03515 [Clostridia bacterium]|nr:hypothetical protein [Clostridia bacterium]
MENKIAVTAELGVSDISGEKTENVLLPEQNESSERFAAESAEKQSEAPSDGNGDETEENENELEKQFEALINGKYRNAYRKRTEGIIKKRLKAGKARPNIEKTQIDDAASAEAEQEKSVSEDSNAEKEAIRTALTRNRLRPTENGCGGSIGVVSKVNVHALKGADVLSIIRRVGAGEKITFK